MRQREVGFLIQKGSVPGMPHQALQREITPQQGVLPSPYIHYPPGPGIGLGPGVISLIDPTSPPHPSPPGALLLPAGQLLSSASVHLAVDLSNHLWPHCWSSHSICLFN
jgi:hypothetical protein